MGKSADNRAALRASIKRGELIVAPGVFDLISLRIADRQGHQALYMTGYGGILPRAAGRRSREFYANARSGPHHGRSEPNPAHRRRGYRLRRATQCAAHRARLRGGGCRSHPARGSGVSEEVRAYPWSAGDCSRRHGQEIQVACAARSDPDLLIIARTDARTAHGLDEAITRASAYRKAGADILFVEAPENVDEFARIAAEVDAPLLANMVDGGRSPILSAATLRELGYRIAIYPAIGFTAGAAALEAAYDHLHATGSTLELETPLYSVEKMHELMGFEAVWDFEKKWGE